MQASTGWPRVEEPFGRALVRNVALAAVVGAVLALQRHDLGLLLPLAALALWFSLGGHYIELAFLNGLRVDRKSTRLNSSHDQISYAVFCLKKKKTLLEELVVC